MSASRERAVCRVFVELASSLVSGHDVVDLLSSLTADCAHPLDVASAGLLLADRRRVLHVRGAELTRQLEVFQVQLDDARVATATSTVDSYREPVSPTD